MYCVIVGDIVNSKPIGDDTDIRKRVTSALRSAFDRINTDFRGAIMASFGMVRGDAFEGVLLTQYLAPQIVQSIIKAAYSVEKTKVYISVAMGQLTITSEDHNDADGPAFHTAFANLEKLKARKSDHWLQVSFEINQLAQSLIDSHFGLLTALTEGWTERQHEIVWAMEQYGKMQKVVSKQLGIAQSVVSKQLKAANYDAYVNAWEGLTEFLVNIDEYTTSEDKTLVEKSYVPYFNMGIYELEHQQNYEAATKHFEEVLKVAKEELDEDDPLLIPIYNKLTWAYLLTDNLLSANNLLERSLQLQKKMSKLRLHYVETLFLKADLNSRYGNIQVAETLFSEAISTSLDTLGEMHPFVAEVYGGYALFFDRKGDYDKALEYYEKTLEIEKNNIDKISIVSYANTHDNIASCYINAGKEHLALPYIKQAIELYEAYLPPNHQRIIRNKLLLSEIE